MKNKPKARKRTTKFLTQGGKHKDKSKQIPRREKYERGEYE